MKRAGFSDRLLAWYDSFGRKDLPWKRSRNPYHIWVSEVMLQQTQVATVMPYFQRFIARFPDVASLAAADLDEVLHHWTGLGYYARARNLHRAAGRILSEHGGSVPTDIETVSTLPGIGRSTAGAILALAFDRRHPILDGNVKRVLARCHAIDQPLNERAVENRLWDLAAQHMPETRIADYTQAIMDLGATVCRRTRPACANCPVAGTCAAHRAGRPEDFPVARTRRRNPVRAVNMLMIRDGRGRVLLIRRPPTGVWGGLWGFPECGDADVRQWCRMTLGFDIETEEHWPVIRHTFSHFQLDITPVHARLAGRSAQAMENGDAVWYNFSRPRKRGFPAPVKHLLEQLRNR